MASKFSIVIVCKNEEGPIAQVMQAIAGLTDDVVVYDSGSTDRTLDVVKSFGVQPHQGEWIGFGKTKQKAVSLAKYDWVLSLDADEAPDSELQQSLRNLQFAEEEVVYELNFKNLLGDKHLRWGEWGGDTHIRLFNRNVANWNDALVHESLTISPGTVVKKLAGHVLHRTMKDTVEYSRKMVNYALLNAEKYFAQGKKASWFKRYINPSFSGFNSYILHLGFLDGWEGLLAARMTFFYTFLKYARLHELCSRETKNVKGETRQPKSS